GALVGADDDIRLRDILAPIGIVVAGGDRQILDVDLDGPVLPRRTGEKLARQQLFQVSFQGILCKFRCHFILLSGEASFRSACRSPGRGSHTAERGPGPGLPRWPSWWAPPGPAAFSPASGPATGRWMGCRTCQSGSGPRRRYRSGQSAAGAP